MTEKLKKNYENNVSPKIEYWMKDRNYKKEPKMKILESKITIMEIKNISREFNRRCEQEEIINKL